MPSNRSRIVGCFHNAHAYPKIFSEPFLCLCRLSSGACDRNVLSLSYFQVNQGYGGRKRDTDEGDIINPWRAPTSSVAFVDNYSISIVVDRCNTSHFDTLSCDAKVFPNLSLSFHSTLFFCNNRFCIFCGSLLF